MSTRILIVLAMLCSWSAWAQPFMRNAFTTNSNGKTPNVLATSTNVLYPLMVLNPDGSGGDRAILFSQSLTLTSTNTTLGGNLSLNALTNKLSISGNKLYLDGVAVVQDSSTTIITNLVVNNLVVSNITVTNITVQNNLTVSNLYTVNGNHNTLIITNNIRFPFTTLTMSGSNVSAMNFTNTAFALTITNAAFIGTPTGLPGTGTMSTYMLHVKEGSAGGFSLTLTNGSFVMNGAGTSTNAVVSLNTNANAVSIITFVSSPFSSSLMYGVTTTTGP